jgi:hypothetical protein
VRITHPEPKNISGRIVTLSGIRTPSSTSSIPALSTTVMEMVSVTFPGSPRSSIIYRTWGLLPSGFSLSIRLLSKTTAMILPATPISSPYTGRYGISGFSCERPMPAACASSPSSCSTIPQTSTRGSSGHAAPRSRAVSGTSTSGTIHRINTRTRVLFSKISSYQTGPLTLSPEPITGTGFTPTSLT